MTLTHKACLAANKPGTKLMVNGLPLGEDTKLLLLVRPRTKSWVLRTRTGSRDTSVKIGEFPAMTIRAASDAALDIVARRRPDPRVKGGTLRDLLEGYIESLGDRPSAKDARWAAGWLLGKQWEHPLSKRPAHMVETRELTALLRARAQAGATTSINRARSTLAAAFNYGARVDNDPTRPESLPQFAIRSNPASLIERKAEFEVARKVVIPVDELPEIWDELVALGPRGAFGRLALLTLQRLKQLERAEMNPAGYPPNTLLIRDTKGRSAKEKLNLLPLSVTMLKAVQDGALVPGLGGYAGLNLTLRRRGYRATDLRRSAETLLSNAGVSGEDRGHLLSHGLERNSLVRTHYDRAQRLPRKAELLRMWEEAVRVRRRDLHSSLNGS